MTERDPSSPEPASTPTPTATLADADPAQGRVGYGRVGRFTPLVLGLLLLLALALLYVSGRTTEPAGEPPSSVNRLAPDVSLTLLDGSPLRLTDLRGNVVVLNFWASWCAPCRDEMPILDAYARAAAERGEATVILGVGVRTDQDAKARSLVDALGLTYPVGRDTDTDEPGVGPIETAFGVPNWYPSTIVIRPDGIVDRFHLGPITESQLAFAVEQARSA